MAARRKRAKPAPRRGRGPNRIAVIDFPWDIGMIGDGSTCQKIAPKLRYKVMTDEQVLAFDVDEFVGHDAGLFVWCPQSKIHVAIAYLKKYGFKYSVMMIWHKDKGITVNGVCYNSELVLFGYRGRHPIKKKGGALMTCFNSRITKHSEKPRVFYGMVCRKTPGPRIDIFARRRHPGFQPWGDQVEPGGQEVLV